MRVRLKEEESRKALLRKQKM